MKVYLKDKIKWTMRRLMDMDFCGILREDCPLDWRTCGRCQQKWIGKPLDMKPRQFCLDSGPFERFFLGNVCYKAQKDLEAGNSK